MGRREASREICEHGSYFRLKDENPASSLNLPRESALGVDGTSGHTFPDLFPPLADSPSCYILSEDLDPSRKNGRNHTSFASYWREGRGYPPSTFLRREIETYIVNVTTTTLEKSYMEKESIKYLQCNFTMRYLVH